LLWRPGTVPDRCEITILIQEEKMKRLTLVLVALAAIVAIATPAMAEYNFYGSVRVKTFYVDNDKNAADDQDFTLELQPNTRFGAKVKDDKLGGRIEFGFKTQGAGVYTRLAYGTYKFDAGTLLVGQTYSPYFSNASQVYGDDRGFSGFGNLWDSRNPQIRFDLNSGLYVAAVKVSPATGANAADDTLLPKMTVGFKNKAGKFAYNLGVTYQSFDTDPVLEESVTSYLGFMDIGFKQDQLSLRTKVHYGQNLSDLGITNRNSVYNVATQDDTTSYGGWVQAGFAGATAGVGYVVDDIDNALETDDQMAAFINYKIKVAKGVTITPELFYKDYMDSSTGVDQGDELAIGAQWKMDF
jgi:hypothetical protein